MLMHHRRGYGGWLMGFVFCWMISSGAAQFPLTWRWSNPEPHGNNIIDMAYTNNLWIQIAERGRIYTSTDLSSWAGWDTGTTNALRALTFFNGKIVVTGENGTVLVGPSVSELRMIWLSTVDWIEGVAGSASLLVAVGDNGAVYTSPNGTDWQRQRVAFSDWLRSVAYGTPGGSGLFVAVGEAGFVATSLDGRTWQPRSIPTAEDLNKVAWHGGQYWAVGTAGVVLTSANGTNWQLINTGATNTLINFVGSPTSKIVLGENELRLQEGRSNWSNELDRAKPLPPPQWTYLSGVWDGQSYILGGRTGMLVEGFKTNSPTSPTFWVPATDSIRSWLWDIKRFNEVYVAVGDQATLMSSVDGVEWDLEVPPDGATNSILLGIGGRTNLAVVVGSSGTIIYSRDEKRNVVSTNSNGGMVTNEVSTLGIVWQSVPAPPVSVDLQGVAALNDRIIVTGGSGTILWSSDLATWTRVTAPTSNFLSSVESFPGGVAAVGDDGTILTSPDGINWAPRPAQTTNWIYRVRYLGGRLVAVGQNGTIMTSGDGMNWTRASSGTTRWLNDVQWIDNTYFVVGNQGTVLASSDAVQWTNVGTITGKSLYGAASSNGRLVMVGIEGVILRSQVSPIVSPVRFIQFPASPMQSSFLFGGEPDQRFRLDRSVDLLNWSIGPVLDISDSTGTLPYVDSQPNSATMQFFRAVPVP